MNGQQQHNVLIAVIKIPLSQGKFALIDSDDSNLINRLGKWSYSHQRTVEYAQARVGPRKKNERLIMHRIIMNAAPNEQVDHINGDGLDNRKSNLRICNGSQNRCNKGKPKNNTSGYKGVTWHTPNKKWVAQIAVNGKHSYIGSFKTKEEAAKAYNKKAKELHGEFARLNNL